jgi:phosphate-selective porin OprO/OprP
MRFNAGLFTNHSIDSSFDNDGWIAAARATYSPQAMGGMLHLGANFNYRNYQNNLQQVRYRARPFLQTTDQRFVDTNIFAAESDMTYGAELGGIFGPFHAVGEAQWLSAKGFSAGDKLEGLDAAGTTTVASDDPGFFSWYAEAGYYLTGETRGYKNGMWDRTKVLKPFSKGGWGALQVNARYDFLDLSTRDLQNGFSNNFTTGVFTASNNLARGGTQTGYLGSLIWIPEDYVRFLLQYTRTSVQGGPFANVVRPGSANPVDKRGYDADSVAFRGQIDF